MFHCCFQASNWDAAYAGGQYWNGNGYYANGNGRANGGYAANGQAAAADSKTQNGQAAAGGGKRARKDKRRCAQPFARCILLCLPGKAEEACQMRSLRELLHTHANV